ncbi:MAG: hypothetical protein KJP06_07645 [Deltaproteobacteria bacterium]|nr:hypothetical protein [Deltaproteobacteria bacterium]
MDSIQFEPFSAPANILLFIMLWIGVCKLLSVFGGWKMLAGEYRAKSAFEGCKLWFKSAGLRRWTHYNYCLTVGADKYGLYMAVLPIFWIGHPPLFFPWQDISTEAGRKRFFGDFVKFTFARQPEVPVIFPERLAARIFKLKEDSPSGLQT